MTDIGQDTVRVFISAPAGSEYEFEISNVENGIKDALQNMHDLNVEVLGAQRLEGMNITRTLFHNIDSADIGVAVFLPPSTSVSYEVALMHSLGIPVISVGREGAEPPFYWKDQLHVAIDDFNLNEVSNKLGDIIYELATNDPTSRGWSNPISQFYGANLIDANAAPGLAVGQFYNFLRYILMDGSVLSSTELEQLVVIQPRSIHSAYDDFSRIRYSMPEIQRDEFITSLHPRGRIVFERVGSYIIDVPTPLQALAISPRYRRVLELMQMGEDPENSPLIQRAEGRMMNSYFSTLRQLAITEAGTNPEKLRFMSVDEFMEAARNS